MSIELLLTGLDVLLELPLVLEPLPTLGLLVALEPLAAVGLLVPLELPVALEPVVVGAAVDSLQAASWYTWIDALSRCCPPTSQREVGDALGDPVLAPPLVPEQKLQPPHASGFIAQ